MIAWFVKEKTTALFAHTLERVQRSADVVRARWNQVPDVAVILGTGLGALADAIEKPTVVEYPEIPDFPVSTVESHAGLLLCGAQFRNQLGAFFLCSSKEFLDWFKTFRRKGGGASAANFFPSRHVCLWYWRFWHIVLRKVRSRVCLRRARRMKRLPSDTSTVELKTGSNDKQHIVAVKPEGDGSKISLVYVQKHGEKDSI